MKSFMKTTLVSVFTASLLAGGAMAQDTKSADPAVNSDHGPSMEEKQKMLDQNSTGSISGGSMMSGDDMGSWQTGKITVVPISTLNDVDPNRVALEDRMKSNPDEVAALQSSIQNNAALKAQLESQNVQLNNIVAAEKATDGSVTFYVK